MKYEIFWTVSQNLTRIPSSGLNCTAGIKRYTKVSPVLCMFYNTFSQVFYTIRLIPPIFRCRIISWTSDLSCPHFRKRAVYNSTFQVSFWEILRGLRVGKCGDSNYIISQKLKVFTAQISKLDQLSLQGARGSRRCSNYLISLLANLPTNTNTNTNINTNTNTNTI